MTPARHAPVTGIVFRRLRWPSEHEVADRLLAGVGTTPSAMWRRGQGELFGLWDLAAPDAGALVAAAATRPLDAGTVELCGLAVRGGLQRRGLGPRLVSEVADALRVDGAACLVARLDGGESGAAALLARAGFLPAAGRDAGWCYLEL